MRNDVYELEVPRSAAAGAALPIKDLLHKTYQLVGPLSATLRIQGTLDGSTWFDLTGDLTAAGAATLTDSKGAEYALAAIRVNTTAFTSGTPRVFVAGYLNRP